MPLCPTCCKDFTGRKHRRGLVITFSRYCSRPCYDGRGRAKRLAPPVRPRPCLMCRREFTPRRNHGVLCSADCRHARHLEIMRASQRRCRARRRASA